MADKYTKSYMIYLTAPFFNDLVHSTLNYLWPTFQGPAILWRWISQERYQIYSYNGIPTGTYTRTQGCHFKWLRVTLSALAKYEITRSIARSLCDSWPYVTLTCIAHTKYNTYTSLFTIKMVVQF